MVLCNNCGRGIPPDAIWCPYCRKNTGRAYLDPSSIKLGGTLGTFAISGAMSITSHVNTPHSLYIERGSRDFKEVWLKLPDEISEAIQSGPQAVDTLDEEVKRRDRAVNITRLIGATNTLFKDKRNAELFREDQLQPISQLHTPCDSSEIFPTKIAGLYSLFEVPRDPLKALVSSPGDRGTIKLIQMWLDENAMSYDMRMIKCWENIGILRNLTPLHANKPKDITPILSFFNIDSPMEFEELWESILNEFYKSLEDWHSVLRAL